MEVKGSLDKKSAVIEASEVTAWSGKVFLQGSEGIASSQEAACSGRVVALSPELFMQPCRTSVLHQVTVWQQSKARQGTRKAKRKAEVSCSKKKPWKQKGTGRARAGAANSPLWVGGGVAHGPLPFTYTGKVPRKVRLMALKGALTDKASHDRITVVESFDAVSGKTKEIVRLLNAAKIDGGAVLVVAGGNIDKVRLACANLQRVEVLPPIGVNVYDLLKSKYVVVDEAGLQGLQGRILEEN